MLALSGLPGRARPRWHLRRAVTRAHSCQNIHFTTIIPELDVLFHHCALQISPIRADPTASPFSITSGTKPRPAARKLDASLAGYIDSAAERLQARSTRQAPSQPRSRSVEAKPAPAGPARVVPAPAFAKAPISSLDEIPVVKSSYASTARGTDGVSASRRQASAVKSLSGPSGGV